eukprot:scaffold18816_cov32-Tisochrysis_lutea.AAC.8
MDVELTDRKLLWGVICLNSSKRTSSPGGTQNKLRIRRASEPTMYMVHKIIDDAMKAIVSSMSTHEAEKRQPSVESTPSAKHVNMNVRSAFIPSTA